MANNYIYNDNICCIILSLWLQFWPINMHSFASEPCTKIQSYYIFFNSKSSSMAMSKFWLCTILVLLSIIVISEQRSLPSSFERSTTKSDFTLSADGIAIVVSGLKLKGKEIVKYKTNRLSPSGPDPKHHWILIDHQELGIGMLQF